jgi:hypothetical protein
MPGATVRDAVHKVCQFLNEFVAGDRFEWVALRIRSFELAGGRLNVGPL